ncbi:hypothetical protein [Geofilum rubicundum]|uniref:hypothetical protein n=1 Tax=Geofilum rubicundum TaxID=472113 RepID=UPI000781E5B7|nr:hypothetical protein [Geofilum rubicundum]
MKSYNKRYISRADFHALQSLRIPYTDFVKGVGYAYTSFGFIPPAHQHRVSALTRVPYTQSYQQTTITQLVDTSWNSPPRKNKPGNRRLSSLYSTHSEPSWCKKQSPYEL